jgi:hypothetical protein
MHALLDDLFASHGICFDGEPTPDGVRAIDGAKASNEPRADSAVAVWCAERAMRERAQRVLSPARQVG